MKQALLVALTLPLIFPASAHAHKLVSFQVNSGVVAAHNIRLGDGPGYTLGAGLGMAVARAFDLTWDVGYTFYPDEDALWPVTFPGGGFGYVAREPYKAFDTSLGIRVLPWRDERIGGAYLMAGGGVTWLARGTPGTDAVQGDEIVDPFVMLGFGLAGGMTADVFLTVEFVARVHFGEDDELYAFYPIRAGIRF